MKVAAIALVVCLCLLEPSLAQPEEAKPWAGSRVGTLLVVNDDAICSREVMNEAAAELRPLANSLSEANFLTRAQPIIRRVVMSEIYDRLLYQQARRDMARIASADDILRQALEDERKRILLDYGGSEARAQAELAGQGSSIEQLMAQRERDMVISAYREAHFDPSFEITRSQLLQYYRSNQSDYRRSASAEFLLIDIQIERFLSAGADDGDEEAWAAGEAEARAAAEGARREIQGGADFGEVARRSSHGIRAALGGAWRPIDPAAMTSQYRPVAEMLSRLQPGQVSEVIAGQGRFFIVKLVSFQPAETVPFSQAQFEILDVLRQERWQRFSLELSQTLLRDASVGNVEQFVMDTALLAYRQLRSAGG